ncbi:MAG: prepilin-type N-terminal cleavage/methylation domain-containing protein [Pseudomonadota bacterium]
MQTRFRTASHGFTLIEVAIVIVIVGLAAIMVLTATRGMLENEKRKTVRITLNTVDAALANFVALHKRLPCPALGTLANGAPNAGVESVTVATGACNPVTQVSGVVPWVTLGLAGTEGSDPWFGRLTYRVDPVLAGSSPLPQLMNMTNCDPSSTGPAGVGGCITPVLPCTGNAGCTSPALFLAGKGLDVWDGRNGAAGFAVRQNHRVNGTGAAYVVISHGPGGTGAYSERGILQPGNVAINPDDEQPNVNNQPVVLAATMLNAYRDAPLQENNALRPTVPGPVLPPQTQTYFDDYLSHPTIMSVLSRANLGPRAH